VGIALAIGNRGGMKIFYISFQNGTSHSQLERPRLLGGKNGALASRKTRRLGDALLSTSAIEQ
jgi:hypothetical protein